MKVEILLENMMAKSGLTCKPEQIAFLHKLPPQSIQQIDSLITRYNALGIKLHRHLDFLLAILSRQIALPPHLKRSMAEFLHSKTFDYAGMIRDSYHTRWPNIARQTSDQVLTYHTSYHALEIALRTNISAKNLGIFVKEDAVDQFLQYILLTIAKYHDYKQWDAKHPIDGDYRTAEEETAAQVINWLIKDFDLNNANDPTEQSIRDFFHYFVPLAIGPGTTLLFGAETLINLSTVYYELENIIYKTTSLRIHYSNQALVDDTQAATEVLGAMDKVSAGNLDIIYYQCMNEGYSILTLMKEITQRDSVFLDFLTSLPREKQYYPHVPSAQTDFVTLETAAILNVAHTEMEIEQQRHHTKAMLLREYIKTGQELHKSGDVSALRDHMQQVLDTEAITDAFQDIYLSKIDKEQAFSANMPDICRKINAKLTALGYLNEDHSSYYQTILEYKRRDCQLLDDLHITQPDSAQSPHPPQLPPHPFLDPHVFERETYILGELKEQMKRLDETEKKRMIQEILIISICQSGIHYSNHPDWVHAAEPVSPIKCKTPFNLSETLNVPLSSSRYSSFHYVHSNSSEETTSPPQPQEGYLARPNTPN